MRILVATLLVLASLPLVAPTAEACHPDFSFSTPSRPSVTVSHGMSCDHRSFYLCVATTTGETCLQHVAP